MLTEWPVVPSRCTVTSPAPVLADTEPRAGPTSMGPPPVDTYRDPAEGPTCTAPPPVTTRAPSGAAGTESAPPAELTLIAPRIGFPSTTYCGSLEALPPIE